MTTVSGDSRLLAGAAGASVAKFRQLVGQIGAKAEKGAY
jgi:4-hydroxy-2-oxoheptanedioate aldolase